MTSELDRLRRVNAELLAILEAIVIETMDYPPKKPYSTNSWLPRHLIESASRTITKARGE